MKIKIAAITDVGKDRENNEDAFIICPDLGKQEWDKNLTSSYVPVSEYGSIAIVADGMGGANAGEVASAIATQTVKDTFTKETVNNCIKNGLIDELLQKAVKKADEAIAKRMWEDPSTAGMGTTIVICWVINDTAHIAWCGDSRCYLYHPVKGLKPLTKDHSYVQELIDKGEITEEESFAHPDSNIITRGLGDEIPDSTPEVVSQPLTPNDLLLLCSDGLSGYCPNKAIENVLSSHYTDIEACRDQLLKLALDAGGYDNVCIALASLIGDTQDKPAILSWGQKFMIRIKNLLKFQ